MLRYLLPLLVVGSTTAPTAQSLQGAHSIPFGSRGNAVELTLVAAEGAEVRVAVAHAPAWLSLTPARMHVLSPASGEALARFVFDVDEHAPVGDTVAVRFEITAGAGQRWTHDIRIAVAAPQVFALGAAYPNPARSGTRLPLLLPEASRVRVVVYDVLGREIAVLADGMYAAGRHEVQVDGHGLASGAYVVRAAMERGTDAPDIVTRSVTITR